MRLAIIPARGGSKRIPRKNVRPFCGKPMIAHPIAQAIRSGQFDRIIVTTDDPEIAEVARAAGAETPFVRPAELSDDHTTTVPVIAHAIRWMQANVGPVAEACCIYATAPFVQSADLVQGFEMLGGVKDYVFSGASMPFPFQRAFALDEAGHVRMFQPENYNARSQDLEPAFMDAGQFYWGRPETFLAGTFFFSPDSKALLLPRYRVQDIDTEEDWRRAEMLHEILTKTGDLTA